MCHLITLHSRSEAARGYSAFWVRFTAWQCDCLAVAPHSLSWWCVNWIARHLQFSTENTTNEHVFHVWARATCSENSKCPLDYCPPDKRRFLADRWKSAIFRLLSGCSFHDRKKSLMKEWHLQFFQMAEEVRMNNSRGRKMLISKKRHGHDLMLLEVVFKPRKHQSVYQISSFLPSGPHSLSSASTL